MASIRQWKLIIGIFAMAVLGLHISYLLLNSGISLPVRVSASSGVFLHMTPDDKEELFGKGFGRKKSGGSQKDQAGGKTREVVKVVPDQGAEVVQQEEDRREGVRAKLLQSLKEQQQKEQQRRQQLDSQDQQQEEANEQQQGTQSTTTDGQKISEQQQGGLLEMEATSAPSSEDSFPGEVEAAAPVQDQVEVSVVTASAGGEGADVAEVLTPSGAPAEAPKDCHPLLSKVVPDTCVEGSEFEELMTERQAYITDYCRSSNNKKNARGMFYLNKVGREGVLWCPVYKAASSSTNKYFCPLYYRDCSKFSATLWQGKSQFSKSKAPRSTPTLLIVRHPWERMLSAYRDKIQALNTRSGFMKPVMERIVMKYRNAGGISVTQKKRLIAEAIREGSAYQNKLRSDTGKFARGVTLNFPNTTNPYLNPFSATFTEFLRAVLQGEYSNNVHWLPASDMCGPCQQHYDYILHVENYDCEFQTLMKELGEHKVKVSETHFNSLNGPQPVSPVIDRTSIYEYYSSVPDGLLELMLKYSKADCALFGYDCEKMLCEIRQFREDNMR